MFILPRCFDSSECITLAARIDQHWQESLARGIEARGFDAGARTVDITHEPLCSRVQAHIEKHLRVCLTLDSAELQAWPTISPPSGLHRHDHNGRETTDWNSLLYLNEDFQGGQFYTDYGLMLKPTRGTLTFFNGRDTLHGVRACEGKNRYTAIFWWKDTRWY